MSGDVVWWVDGGTVLHRDPDCPLFVWVCARAIHTFGRGRPEKAPVIRSYDFEEDNATVGDGYPPEHLGLCDRCGR